MVERIVWIDVLWCKEMVTQLCSHPRVGCQKTVTPLFMHVCTRNPSNRENDALACDLIVATRPLSAKSFKAIPTCLDNSSPEVPLANLAIDDQVILDHLRMLGKFPSELPLA